MDEAILAEVGDVIRFERDGKLIRGEVATVDAGGGGVCDGIEPSCDAMGDDGVFYKHVPTRAVTIVRRGGGKVG